MIGLPIFEYVFKRQKSDWLTLFRPTLLFQFDPASVPLKRWEEFEAELSSQYKTSTQTPSSDDEDTRSLVSASTHYTASTRYTASAYGPTTPSVYTPTTAYERSHSSGSTYPTSAELLNEIRRMIAEGNLMTMTKKQIRESLSARFGVDLVGRREEVNGLVDEVLREMGAVRL